MFYDRHVLGLQPAEARPSVALHFGLSVHKALEHWFAHRDDDAAVRLFAQDFEPFAEQPQISAKTGKELSATYTVIFGCSILTAYFNKYRNDTREVVDLEVPIAEEVVDNIFLAGRVDKLVKGPLGLVFVDYKTSKYINKFRVNPNGQFMTYKWLSEKLTGQRVSGEVDLIGISKTKDVDDLLRREPFDYTTAQMQAWSESVGQLVLHIEDCYNRNEWPQTWKCDPFFRECDYVPLCTAPDDDTRQRTQEQKYVVQFWDPFQTDD
jgi:hypothetical protein